jgi:hypothetical protein
MIPMAQERLEVRFSPTNTEEKAIIDALDRLGDEYGAKGRFLKSRLMTGYVRIIRELESIRSEKDPLAALDRVAKSMNSASYYALRSLLYTSSGSISTPVLVAQVATSAPAVAALSDVVTPVLELAPAVAAPLATSGPAVEVVEAISTVIEPRMADMPVETGIEPSLVEPLAQVAVEIAPVAVEPEPVDDAAPAQEAIAPSQEETGTSAAATQAAAPAAAPRPNWGRFAGIAGTAGTKGEE